MMNDNHQSTAWIEGFLAFHGENVKLRNRKMTPIRNFPLIWNIFEDALTPLENELIQNIREEKKLDEKKRVYIPQSDLVWEALNRYAPSERCIAQSFDAFVARYVRAKDGPYRLNQLWPEERGEYRSEVTEILKSKNPSSKQKNIACGMICLRLRNNLFHGRKELVKIPKQSLLFNAADYYLEKLIEGFFEVQFVNNDA